MTREQAPTYRADIFLAGDYAAAVLACRDFCMAGLCVTVERVDFVYTGGMESGVRVGLINYPRFPAKPEEIFGQAERLAEHLVAALFQHSASIVASDKTVWISRRGEAA